MNGEKDVYRRNPECDREFADYVTACPRCGWTAEEPPMAKREEDECA